MAKKLIRLLPDAKPLERFESVFVALWKDFMRLRKKVSKKSAPDDIHDLRIALRRLRLALKLFEYFTSSDVKKKFKKSLRKLSSLLGDLRNIDEAMQFFCAHTSFSASHPFYKKLKKIRTLEWRRLKKPLHLFEHQFDKLVQNMRVELNAISFTKKRERSMLTFFSNLSDHYSKTIHDLLAVSIESKQWKSRHTLRIAIRKWRYILEIYALVLDRDYDSFLNQLKKYQLILGRMNDVVAFSALCRGMKLSSTERKLIEIILLKEERVLLKKFSKLIKQKPLKISRGRFNTSQVTPFKGKN